MTEIQIWAVIGLTYAGVWHAINTWAKVRSREIAEEVLMGLEIEARAEARKKDHNDH